ncbi:SpoIIE family protein phosphatase [Kineococcus siccus]|uniref:SpoIIE family protein phosphatase n=1 Tax=Kineococcus siccus TaxID=2696567 RepID=UPI0030B7F95B
MVVESSRDAADREHVRRELAVAAGGVGSFDLDLSTGTLTWDERMLELFGYGPGQFDGTMDAFRARLHPADHQRVAAAVDAAVQTCGSFDVEYRVVVPGRPARWVQARGRALAGPDGRAVRVLGASYDTTRDRESDAAVARVLEAMPAAFYSLDTEWRLRYVNGEAERLLGASREELLGGVLWDLFPAALGSEFETRYRVAVASGQPATFEAYYPPPLDGWFELRVWPDPDGLSVYFLDVSARRASQEAAERSARQLHLLAEVGADLSSTLDVETAVARLAQHLVPVLADWCLVTLVDEHGTLRDVGCHHADPARQGTLETFARLRAPGLQNPASAAAAAVREGRPVVVAGPAATALLAPPGDPGLRAAVAGLAPASATVLPLQARGRTVGLVLLARGASRPALAGDELATAVQVTDRAALALDNARLYGQQQRIAEGLQRNLLTAPVEPDHVEVVVRYHPAAEAAQVGGDWYDAFQQPSGATVLVIGDVMGHDVDAAAAMSQVRSLLRGIAVATGDGPARLLTGLDAAVQVLRLDTTATALVARIEQDREERQHGVTWLRWSSAGHPPPVLLTDDGAVSFLDGRDPDLLLGIDPATARRDEAVLLDRGATVLLYTDGLVERRDQPLDAGLERLRRAVAELAGAPLGELCDGVLARLLPPRPEDDVALVAVRLHPQDGPRPAAAGPGTG